ncbi:MAG: HAD-IA family hydrolase [Candidatus Aenigmarchaeota archaeon]|nr:HAD-IA family hydrolase [Candidatus Aenigmarchaeota archaeon]
MINTIIFDAGGVFVKGTSKEFFIKISKILKVDSSVFIKRKYIWDNAQKGEISLQDAIEEIFDIPISEEKMVEIINVWKRNFKLDIAIRDFAKKLSKDYRIFILSNIDTESVELFKDHREGFDFVEEEFLSCKLGMKKPDREIYEYVLNKINVKPEKCVFIDDKPENIEGAEKVGIHGIVFKNKEQLKRELRKLGVKVD